MKSINAMNDAIEIAIAKAEAEKERWIGVIVGLRQIQAQLEPSEIPSALQKPKPVLKKWNSPPEPKPKPQAKPVKTLEPRDCAYCGLKFRPAHALKKYCSAKCAEDSNRTKSAKLYAEKTGKSTKKPEEV